MPLSPDLTLQPHQERIQERSQEEDPRLLVYHGLGSGKSLSAIAAAEAARQNYGHDYGVVLPASLRGNFQKELKKFAPGSNPEMLSYTGMALGKKFSKPPATLIMDEAQRLRNPESAAARAARDAARQAKRVLLLSGTPITNSPGDMASLISMLQERDISPKDFEKRYIGYKSKFPGIIPWLRGAQWGEVPYVRNEKELRKLLQGKIDYQPSKLPEGVDVQEKQIHVPLSKAQQKIQKALRTQIPPGFLWKLDQEFPLSREELAKLNSFLTGMRQVSLSTQPFRADKDPAKAFDQSSKLQEALKNLQATLESDPRKKALIYSNFIDSGIDPYSKALERAGIPYGVFHGGVPTEARQRALRDYNEGKLRALLIGPAGAEGISTKGTNLIQLLDPHWNEARLQQARGRGLRFDSHAGLPEDLRGVEVQRYLSKSDEPGFLGKLMGQRRQRTGDEVLESLSRQKEQLNEAFRKILQDVGREKYKTDKLDEDEEQDVNAPVRKAASVAARSLAGQRLALLESQPGVRRVSMYPRPHPAMRGLEDAPLSGAEAHAVLQAMRGQAPHGGLDYTQVQLNGADLSRMHRRVAQNPRAGHFIKRVSSVTPDNPRLRDVRVPDAYLHNPDIAVVPSAQGGVLMHELGHALDYNSHPNTGTRRLGASLYRKLAPRVWREAAAWRKGRNAFVQGAAQNSLPPELVAKVLDNTAKMKPVGMGSYYGAALGKLLGTGVLGSLGSALGESSHEKLFGATLGGGVGYHVGGGIGGPVGLGLGQLIASSRAKHMPKIHDKHLAEYAKVRAQLAQSKPAAPAQPAPTAA